MRVVASLAVAALLSFGVAACGGSSGGDTTGAGSSDETTAAGGGGGSSTVKQALGPLLELPTKITVTEPLGKAPPKGKQVYFLSNGIEAAQLVGAGVGHAAAALGWSSKVLTIDQADPTSTNSAMLSAINAGADAVIVVTTPEAQFSEALKVAGEKGVAVIDMGTDDSGPGLTPVAQSSASGKVLGESVAKLLEADAEEAGETIHLADVSAPLIASILRPTDDALRDRITRECSECTYERIDLSTKDFLSGGGIEAVISALQRNPEINYLQFTTPAPEGWYPALTGAGLTDVKVTANASEYNQGLVQEGKMLAVQAQSYEVMGWTLVDAAARQIVGDDTTGLAKVLAAPNWILTGETEWTIAPDIAQPPDFEQQYEELWGVG